MTNKRSGAFIQLLGTIKKMKIVTLIFLILNTLQGFACYAFRLIEKISKN